MMKISEPDHFTKFHRHMFSWVIISVARGWQDRLIRDDDQSLVMSIIESIRSDPASGVAELQRLVESNPSVLVNEISNLLSVSFEFEDQFTSFNILSSVNIVCQSIPQAVDLHFSSIMDALDRLSQMQLRDEDMLGMARVMLMGLVHTKFQMDPSLLQVHAPVLFRLMNAGGSVAGIASAPLTQAVFNSPQVVAPYVEEIFKAIKNGNETLISALVTMYNYNREGFEREYDTLIELYQTNMTYRSTLLSILAEVSKGNGALAVPHLDKFAPALQVMATSSMAVIIFTEAAKVAPEEVAKYVDQMVAAIGFQPHLGYTVPNILGIIGQKVPEMAPVYLEKLWQLSQTVSDEMLPMVLSEMRNLGETNPQLLEPYIQGIRTLEGHDQEHVRDNARAIVDMYEGRTLRTLAMSIEEQNRKIREAVKSTEDLMKYVDENISMLKDFIAEINKKLPTPRKFSTEGRIRKTLILHFVCEGTSPNCLFPEDRPFTTETKDWNKWLKIAFSGIKLGKSLIVPASAGDAVSAVKDAYEAYKEKYDKDFLAYISEPFLTSQEQDSLVNQLREAKFFNIFNYDAQTAHWICTMCTP